MYTCTVNTTGDYCIINCLFYILLKSLYSLCSALCEWSQPISAHRSRRQIFLILLQWNFIHLLFSFSFLPLFARWRLFCADSLRSQVSHVCHRVTWLLPLLHVTVWSYILLFYIVSLPLSHLECANRTKTNVSTWGHMLYRGQNIFILH